MRNTNRSLLFAMMAMTLAAFCGLPPAMQMTQAAAAGEIVTLPNKPPQRSGERDPSVQALLETWLNGYGWGKDKRFDLERYEIVSRRVVWGCLLYTSDAADE